MFLMHVLIKLARDCRVSYLHCQRTYEIISFADATGGTSVFVYVWCVCVRASVCVRVCVMHLLMAWMKVVLDNFRILWEVSTEILN